MHFVTLPTNGILLILLPFRISEMEENLRAMCNISLLLTDCGFVGLEELEIEAAFLRVTQG